MALDNISDGVGKKIVEALKMHDDCSDDDMMQNEDTSFQNSEEDIWNEEETFSVPSQEQVSFNQEPVYSSLNTSIPSQPLNVDSAFQQSLANTLGKNSAIQFADDFEYPANVAVLKQLISKLPTGVSKQTGALIIKQTMEALGISMNSVLQEARQVQETFANNSKDCQNNIVEYRKQIGILEAKAQQYQRQYAVMNDIINLFVQTGAR